MIYEHTFTLVRRSWKCCLLQRERFWNIVCVLAVRMKSGKPFWLQDNVYQGLWGMDGNFPDITMFLFFRALPPRYLQLFCECRKKCTKNYNILLDFEMLCVILLENMISYLKKYCVQQHNLWSVSFRFFFFRFFC